MPSARRTRRRGQTACGHSRPSQAIDRQQHHEATAAAWRCPAGRRRDSRTAPAGSRSAAARSRDTIGRLPAMKMTEPYSPTARAKASAAPVRDGRQQRRQDDPAEDLPRRGAQHHAPPRPPPGPARRAPAAPCAPRRAGRRTAARTRSRAACRRRLIPSGASTPPDPAVRHVQRGQRDAGHRGRQRERQVDRRIQQPPPGKPVALQHPGQQHARRDAGQRGGGRRRRS